MNFKNLDTLIYYIEYIFDHHYWNETVHSNLGNELIELENKIEKEIISNLFGKNTIEKEDVIKTYINNIGEINFHVFLTKFDEVVDVDDPTEDRFIFDKLKESYQYIIDIIGHISIRENIDLIKIVDNNPITKGYLNIDIYRNDYNELVIQKGTKQNKFISEFTSKDAYNLFEYLIKNFDKKYSDHNKASCIYRMMINEGLLSNDLKAEKFRSYIKTDAYNTNSDFFLLTEDKLSKKIIKHYQLIKSKYFESLRH